MSLFNSSVFPGHFQPASCIVQDRQVALAMVDVKCVFERSLFYPRVLCWKKRKILRTLLAYKKDYRAPQHASLAKKTSDATLQNTNETKTTSKDGSFHCTVYISDA